MLVCSRGQRQKQAKGETRLRPPSLLSSNLFHVILPFASLCVCVCLRVCLCVYVCPFHRLRPTQFTTTVPQQNVYIVDANMYGMPQVSLRCIETGAACRCLSSSTMAATRVVSA